MIITYIGHSGFLAELPHCYLLFDSLAGEPQPEGGHAFETGTLPAMDPEKHLVVFVSHSHRDHYSHAIWELRKTMPHITYVLSSDIPFSTGVRRRFGLRKEDLARVVRVYPEKEYAIISPQAGPIQIHALRSTDIGVAFLVQAEEKTLFHAGDLHLWLWEEEGPEYMQKMQEDFDAFTAPLEELEVVDAAFLLLDDRLETHTFDGMDAYLGKMQVSHCFPMHLWGRYELIPRYKQARAGQPFAEHIHEITHPGQQFVIE